MLLFSLSNIKIILQPPSKKIAMGTNTDETHVESNSKTKKIVNKNDDHTFEAPAGATYEDEGSDNTLEDLKAIIDSYFPQNSDSDLIFNPEEYLMPNTT